MEAAAWLAVSGGIVSAGASVAAFIMVRRSVFRVSRSAVEEAAEAIVRPLREELAACRFELSGLRGAVRLHLASCPKPGDLQRKLDEVP